MNQQPKTDFYQVIPQDCLNNLVGIPYVLNGRSVEGMDCYGLVHHVYNNVLNIHLDSLDHTYSDGEIHQLAQVKHDEWVETDTPLIADVILFRQGKQRHVGLYLDQRYMLHTSENSNSCIERYDSFRWKNNIIGTFRHKCRR